MLVAADRAKLSLSQFRVPALEARAAGATDDFSAANWAYRLEDGVCSRLWREAVHLCWEMRLHLRAYERWLSVTSCSGTMRLLHWRFTKGSA